MCDDFYTKEAAKRFMVEPKEVTPAMRQRTKQDLLHEHYGMGPKKFHTTIGVRRKVLNFVQMKGSNATS